MPELAEQLILGIVASIIGAAIAYIFPLLAQYRINRVLSAGLRRCKENDGCTGARHG